MNIVSGNFLLGIRLEFKINDRGDLTVAAKLTIGVVKLKGGNRRKMILAIAFIAFMFVR